VLVLFAEGSNGFGHVVFGSRDLEVVLKRGAGRQAVTGDVDPIINTLGHGLILQQGVKLVLGRCVAGDVTQSADGSANRFYPKIN